VTTRGGLFGIRVLDALGQDHRIRILLICLWPALLVAIPAAVRPDLLFPGDFGSDTSNYLATAQRASAGHPIYAMSPGDRPTAVDNPPEWDVPILSPPTVAILWLPATWVPEVVGLYASWGLGLATTTVLGLLIVWKAPGSWVILTMPLLTGLATTAWSGNVNALLGATLPLLWLVRTVQRRSVQIIIGAVVGGLAAVKLAPIFLVAYLVGQRRWTAVISGGLVALVLGAEALSVGGLEAVSEYLAISRSAVSAPSPNSLPGLLAALGLPYAIQTALYLAALAASVLAIVGTGRRLPGLSLAFAIIAVVFATPVVRLETIGILVALAVPHIRGGSRSLARAVLRVSVISVVASTLAVIVSISAGGAATSSLTIINGGARPLVVRFELAGQTASFGFRVTQGKGSAWYDRVGTASRAWVFDAEACKPVAAVEIPRAGGTLEVRGDGRVRSTNTHPPAPALAYSSRCATEMKGLLRG